MDTIYSYLHAFLGSDLHTAGLIILNLIVIESLLSVDNAAVLATMVIDLPKNLRNKALRIGLICAYIFRGLALFFAAWLIQIWWLKPLGGAYLLYLTISYFTTPKTIEEDEAHAQKDSRLFKKVSKRLGKFWATVLLVELMDMAFSLDNVFAAVAYVDNVPAPFNLHLVWVGVFIGILAMRLVASVFVKLIERFPFLESSAFFVIGILGFKLFLELPAHFFPNPLFDFIESERSDALLSALTIGIFVLPILSSLLFGIPKKKEF